MLSARFTVYFRSKIVEREDKVCSLGRKRKLLPLGSQCGTIKRLFFSFGVGAAVYQGSHQPTLLKEDTAKKKTNVILRTQTSYFKSKFDQKTNEDYTQDTTV